MAKTTMTWAARDIPAISKDASSEIPPDLSLPIQKFISHVIHDTQSLQTTQHKPKVTNYLEWSQLVVLAIKGKWRLGYSTGATKVPKEESDNSMIMVQLVNSTEPKISRSYLHYKTARNMGYGKGNVFWSWEFSPSLGWQNHFGKSNVSVTEYFNNLTM